MATKITVTYKNNDYVLEFSRATAQQLEEQGFSLERMEAMPNKMIPLLVYYSFAKNNRGIKRSLVDEIYANIVGKIGKDGEDGFIATLAEMYAETVETLTDDSSVEEGNAAIWKVTKG